MWKLKNKTNNKNKLIGTEKKLMVARWEVGEGVGEKGERIKMYKLPVIE